MAECFIGEIRIVGFNFAPIGWARCDGSLVAIEQNDALFALLGTTYGGDGIVTFALPNLQNRCMVGQNGSHPIGQSGGVDDVTLQSGELPSHSHQLMSSATTTSTNPANLAFSVVHIASRADKLYGPAATGPGPLTSVVGGNQSHNNRSPYLGMLHIIAMEGIFPSQS